MSDSEIDRWEKNLGTEIDKKFADSLPQTRCLAMMKAWAAGYMYEEIAEKFQLPNAAVAQMVVERALASSNVPMNRERERQRMATTLMGHHVTAVERARDDDDPDQQAWMAMDLRIVDRYAKLLGLDAPVQVVVTPGAADFEKLTSFMASANGAEDIIDVDPMDDDDEA